MRYCTALMMVALAGAGAMGSAFGGETEALAISANIQARHLPFGTIADPIFAAADSNVIIGYTRCGDSAIWTGHYLAAEAFRYKVTQSPDALAAVRNAAAWLKGLVDVTGTNVIARCLVPINSPFAAGIAREEAPNGIFTNSSAGYIWVGNTSRDQYLGAIFGLAVAFDLVDDAALRASISDVVTRLVDYLRGHNWSVGMPDGSISTTFLGRSDQILGLLQVARRVNPDRFSTFYDLQRVLLSLGTAVPIALEVTSDSSYFKFNLAYINFYNLVRLENDGAYSLYKGAYDILRNHTAPHQNAFFNVIDRALNGPNTARDAETRRLLDAWLQRPRRDGYVDARGAVDVCGDAACQPVPVPLRPPTDFLWQRNPFQLAGGGSGIIESAGVDYILPYWMGRYYEVISDLRVQSAAAAIPSVAPDSIASIFGANLSSGTAQAGTPLPISLGGVTVNVRDSAGVSRSAPLIYVSPGQINLLVPAGTAPGQAQFGIANSNGQTQTVNGTVQRVSPALFTMNGAGTGVVAATAIRVLAGNPQIQSPVPVFQCNAAGCTAIPIDLGIDTPVYLSLYATGVRNRTSLDSVRVTINGTTVPVLYAGPQPQFPGLDQINVPLTLGLRGSGEVNVALTVDGQTSNTGTINIR